MCSFEFEWEGGGGGHLFEAGHLLTFSALRIGTYSRWVLTRGQALIRINTVCMTSRMHIYMKAPYLCHSELASLNGNLRIWTRLLLQSDTTSSPLFPKARQYGKQKLPTSPPTPPKLCTKFP